MALIEKVAALREQIGVPAGGGSIPDDVQAIAKQLGVWEKVQGKPLLEQVDDCYHVVFADAKPVATADVTPQVVVVTGQPVASAGTVVPLLVGSLAKVAVEPTPTPKPKPKADLKLGSTPSHGSPPSNGALNTELNNVARNTNDTARARALVEAGADLSSTNGPHWRHTPLHQACYHGRFEMARALLELGADTRLHSNPCGRGRHGTPLELARGGNHERVVALLLNPPSTSAATAAAAAASSASSSATAATTATTASSSSSQARAGPAGNGDGDSIFTGERLWDKSLHRNGGPRDDQSLPCLTICCAAPFVVCPLHCLAAWGCDGAVGALTYAAPRRSHRRSHRPPAPLLPLLRWPHAIDLRTDPPAESQRHCRTKDGMPSDVHLPHLPHLSHLPHRPLLCRPHLTSLASPFVFSFGGEQERADLDRRLLLPVLAQLEEPALVLRRAARLGLVLWAAAHRHVPRRQRRQAAHEEPRRRDRRLRRETREAHARQDGQSGRLGEAIAGHGLIRLHLRAWGCPPHSRGEAQHLRPLREVVAFPPEAAQVADFAAFDHPGTSSDGSRRGSARANRRRRPTGACAAPPATAAPTVGSATARDGWGGMRVADSTHGAGWVGSATARDGWGRQSRQRRQWDDDDASGARSAPPFPSRIRPRLLSGAWRRAPLRCCDHACAAALFWVYRISGA